MKTLFVLCLATLSLFSCGQKQIKTPEKAMEKFEVFKRKEKFLPDTTIFYPGIADLKLKPIFTEKINLAADDFKEIAKKETATREAIKKGLHRFDDVYGEIGTEDLERICHYFEELMDIVGLESSGGLLNEFRYGVDFKH